VNQTSILRCSRQAAADRRIESLVCPALNIKWEALSVSASEAGQSKQWAGGKGEKVVARQCRDIGGIDFGMPPATLGSVRARSVV
jgi:hypothetical protein